MNSFELSATIPSPVANKLRLIRRRTMRMHLGSAIVAAIAALLAGMAVAMLIDWLAALYDSRWRFVLTAAALSASALTLMGWLWFAGRRALTWRRLASEVDSRVPPLQERWTTITGLRPLDARDPQRVHPAMLQRVAAEAARWEPRVAPERVVSLSPLLRMLAALTAIAVVLLIAAALDARRTIILLQRFWRPGASISATTLVAATGDSVVGRGEPITLDAIAEGAPVDRATLVLRSSAGQERVVQLTSHGRDATEFSYLLRAVDEGFAYRFRAGDGQTAWHNVEIADRPEIKRIQLTISPPKYAKRPVETIDRLPPRLSVMQQSQFEVAVLPKRPVRDIELRLDNERYVPLVRGADGWYRWSSTAAESFSLAPRLTELHGLSNRNAPKCLVNVYPDKPPSVKVVTPDDEIAVRPDDTIEIQVSAQDDVGIASAELLVYDGSGPDQTPIATIPIALNDQRGKRTIESTVDLDLKQFQVVDGAELSYAVRVREDRGEAVTTNSSQASGASQASAAAPTTAQASSAGSPPATQNSQPQPEDAPGEPSQPSDGAQASAPISSAESTNPPPAPQEAVASSAPPRPQGPNGRMLDVPQSATSQRRTLKIDQWAGSFTSQQREKIEMAIAPQLEALDKALAKAERIARGVLDDIDDQGAWRPAHDADAAAAQQNAVDGQDIIAQLQRRSKGTPYAFIGLQVVDIGIAHVDPARRSFWTALQATDDARGASVHDGWEHVGRARKLLADLRGQFERTQREFQLAEAVDRVKKMYQVYVENTQALLDMKDNDPVRYQRKIAELDFDDEYLARLKEVLELRRAMQAELARILAEDPRLLRRFMDLARSRAANLREQLADLVADQETLNREVRAWAEVDETNRSRMAQVLLLRQLQDMGDIAAAAGELESRYQTWLPLDREAQDDEVAAATAAVENVAAAAAELANDVTRYVDEAQRSRVVASAEDAAEGDQAPTTPEMPAWDSTSALGDLLAKGKDLQNRLSTAEVALQQLAVRDDAPEAAAFAANRLVELIRIVADASAWTRQTEAHASGNYGRAAEVDQYRLAMKTDELAGKLGSIEQTLAALVGRSDGKLPAAIAGKAREFLAMLDEQATPNQLAAVYSLRSDQPPRAVDRQRAAAVALSAAEQIYDDMVRLAISEMDKLPVQDPIADLLDDPTLDELLAQLEQEGQLAELLGIPPRPSNLQIVGDWLRPNAGIGLAAGGGRFLQQQMRIENMRNRRRLDQAYRRAIARALKEAANRPAAAAEAGPRLTNWNRLVSQLGDDLVQGRDKAPPEPYRRAIEQYFSQLSREAARQQDQPAGE